MVDIRGDERNFSRATCFPGNTYRNHKGSKFIYEGRDENGMHVYKFLEPVEHIVLNKRRPNLRDASKLPISPYEITVAGVGYVGDGPYSCSGNTKIYCVWYDMLKRCYSPRSMARSANYEGCVVDPIWHNFQTFCSWYIKEESRWSEDFDLQLDKDLLSNKGRGKVYSPITCRLLPGDLNTVMIVSTRGKAGLEGIARERISVKGKPNTYTANGQCNGKTVNLGTYSCKYEACKAYIKCKQEMVMERARKYWEFLDNECVAALVTYLDFRVRELDEMKEAEMGGRL